MTAFVKAIVLVTTSKPHGNALAGLVGYEPGNSTSFNYAEPLREIGGDGSTAAWWQAAPATNVAYALAAEFAGNGPYPLLNGLGMTNGQIAEHKEHSHVLTGDRAEVFAQAYSFLTSLGYEPIPRGQ